MSDRLAGSRVSRRQTEARGSCNLRAPAERASRMSALLASTALVAVSAAISMGGSPALAQQSIWTGLTDNDYGTAGNWDNGNPPTTNTQSALFADGGTNTNVSVAAPVTVQTWSLDGSATSYSITGSTITFSNGLSNTSNVAQSIANIVDGSNITVLQNGTGTLTLSGTNTYSGFTLLQTGTLSLANSSALGTSLLQTSAGTVIDYANGINITNGVALSGGTTQFQVLTGTATQTGGIEETVAGSGIEKIGSGTLVFGAGSVNAYTGTTTITAGTLAAGAANAFSANSDHIVATGATLDIGGFDQSILSLTGAGTVTNGGTNSPATLTVGLNNTGNTTAFVFDGVIQDGAGTSTTALTVQGSRPMVLTGDNTYTGLTNICSCGTLQLGNGGATGSIAAASDVYLGGTLIFNRNNTYTFDNTIVDFGGNVVQAGTGTTYLTQANNYSGGTTISAGILQVAKGSSGGTSSVGTGTVTLNGGTFQSDGASNLNFNNAFKINGTGGTLDSNGKNLTLSGTISNGTFGAGGPGQLVIIDSTGTFNGKTVLSGNNSYSGGTLVSNTQLQVRNSNAVGTGTVTLNDSLFQLGGLGNLTFSNNFKISDTTFGSAIDNNNRILTINGNITDGSAPGSLMFQNAGPNGRTILNGTNTYTGGTDICSCATVQLGDATHTASLMGKVTNEGTFSILNANTAGITDLTNDGGTTRFFGANSASSAAIVNTGGGRTSFFEQSTAGSAMITNRFGSATEFLGTSTAGDATITNRFNGTTNFLLNSSAGSATITNRFGGLTNFGAAGGNNARAPAMRRSSTTTAARPISTRSRPRATPPSPPTPAAPRISSTTAPAATPSSSPTARASSTSPRASAPTATARSPPARSPAQAPITSAAAIRSRSAATISRPR